MSSIRYRADIDGLRAISVLSVFLFHLNKNVLPGGFLGVDIFFVISGYLITLILLKEITSQGFIDIKEFYRKRIKRILPSFFVVLLVSTLISILLLLPKDLIEFAKSVKAAILIHSNVFFGNKESYFSTDSDEFPLLHTWSLSVEEQFYFFWPLLLTFLFKRMLPRTKIVFLWITVIILLGVGQYFSLDLEEAQWSYFFGPTRFAEILIGCIGAYQVHTVKLIPKNGGFPEVLGILGIISILVGMITISENSIFPGFLALLPCVGAYFCLISGSFKDAGVHKILSISLLRWIGLHSYAIYLWHWCLLAFYRYYSGETLLGFFESVVILILTFVFSWISRKFIEVPFNKSQHDFKYIFTRYFLLPTLIFFSLSLIFRNTNGLEARLKEPFSLTSESSYIDDNYCHDSDGKICHFNGAKKKNVLLFGDSIAGYYAPILLELFKDLDVSFYSISSARCLPLLPLDGSILPIKKLDIEECSKTLKTVQSFLDSHEVDLIIIAGKWSNVIEDSRFPEELESMIEAAKARAHNLVVLGTLPYFDDKDLDHFRRTKYSPASRLFNIKVEKEDYFISFNENDKQRIMGNLAVQKALTESSFGKYVDMEKLIMKRISLPFDQNKILYSDGYHLNNYGANVIAKIIKIDLKNEFKFLIK